LREKGVKRALEIARTVEDGQPDGDERLHEPVVSATRGCGTMRRLPDGKLAAVAGPFGCQKLSCPGGKPVRQNGDPLAKRITRTRSCQENQAPPYAGLGTSFSSMARGLAREPTERLLLLASSRIGGSSARRRGPIEKARPCHRARLLSSPLRESVCATPRLPSKARVPRRLASPESFAFGE